MKLHLGCGKRHIPGFVHVDRADFAHIDHNHSVDSLPFFSDSSADLIYASHVLEYFDRVEVLSVLKEWGRVLKPGGILRLAVPGFEELLKVYSKSSDLNKILGPLFGRMEIKGPDSSSTIYHKTVYDFPSLCRTLEENGFANVRKYNWRETIHSEYDDHSQAYYPHMDKDRGILISLNVEATRRA